MDWIRRSALCLLLAVGCSSKKKAPEAEEDGVASCEETADCETGQICLDGECASTAPGAIYSDTENAVTPDKVKSEVERINEKADQRANEILEGL